MQWQIKANSTSQKFTLECPFSSMCTNRCEFKWDGQKYVRGEIHIFHDHCVQFRSIDHITAEAVEKAKKIIEENTSIRPSQLLR